MENTGDNWRRKIFGSQLDAFTMDNEFFNTSTKEVNTSEGDTLALNNSFYDEELYNICATVERNIAQFNKSGQQTVAGKVIKRELDSEDNKVDGKKAKHEEQPSSPYKTSNVNTNCVKTEVLNENNLAKHLKQHITATESIYGKDVLTYKITFNDAFASIKSADVFVNSISDTILFLIKKIIDEHNAFHVGFILHVDIQQSKHPKSFETVKSKFVQGDNLQTFHTHLLNTLSSKIRAVESKFDSVRIKCIDMVGVTDLKRVASDLWEMSIEEGIRKII